VAQAFVFKLRPLVNLVNKNQILVQFFLMSTSFAFSDLRVPSAPLQVRWADETTLIQRGPLWDEDTEVGKEASKKIGWMYVLLGIDFMWIAVKMLANFGNLEVGFGCDYLFTLVWYPLTVYVLGGVFPGTDLSQGLDMVTQQLTSMGYGGANVRGNDQKLFHAVNGLASQMGPNGVAGWLTEFFIDWVIAGLPSILYNVENEKLSPIFENGFFTEKAEGISKRWEQELDDRVKHDVDPPKNGKEPMMQTPVPEDGYIQTVKKQLARNPEPEQDYPKEMRPQQIAVLEYMGEKMGLEKMEKWKQMLRGILLLVFGAMTFFLLFNPEHGEHGALQAFYATLISATTVGYGDISPSANWQKQLSAFVLPVLTYLFAIFYSTALPGGDNKQFKDLHCPDLDKLKERFLEKRRKAVMFSGRKAFNQYKENKLKFQKLEMKKQLIKIYDDERRFLEKNKRVAEIQENAGHSHGDSHDHSHKTKEAATEDIAIR